MVPTVDPSDQGKPVVTADGEELGTVVRTAPGVALVRPREGLLDGCGSWLTGTWSETDAFELDEDAVERITPEAVVIGDRATASHVAEE